MSDDVGYGKVRAATWPQGRPAPATRRGGTDLFYVICKHYDEFILGMRNSRHVPRATCPRHMFMPVVHRAYPWQVALQQSLLPFGRDAQSCN